MHAREIVIMGGGLAGCVLALQAMERGLSVAVHEPDQSRASSCAAAGIVNPVTGMRFSRAWRIDSFLPSSRHFFSQWSERWNTKLWHDSPVLRLFRSPELRDGFFQRRSLSALSPYATRLIEPEEPVGPVHNPYGGVWVDGGGWVDVPRFLTHTADHLKRLGAWIPSAWTAAEPSPHQIVVDCRGYVSHDPLNLWPMIPWKPAKGEVLTLEDTSMPRAHILNRSQFILPVTPSRIRFGSTYEWTSTSAQPSEAGRLSLQSSWSDWIGTEMPTAVAHHAGIRPIVRDQKPVIGTHPTRGGWAIFNGMGSKGVSWSCGLADPFLDHLIKQRPLDREVDVRRWS